MTRADAVMDRAERLIAELREATREAAGVVKDLERAMKQAREQVDGYYSTKVKATLDAHTERWDTEVIERLRKMTEQVNETAGKACARAEAAITNATEIEGAAEHLAKLIAARVAQTPEGSVLRYGTLTNPATIELG